MSEGLKIETAASVVLRDTVEKYFQVFSHVIREDKAANVSVAGVAISTLAGVIALTVVGGFASKEDALDGCISALREAVDRDLRHLGTVRVHTAQTPD